MFARKKTGGSRAHYSVGLALGVFFLTYNFVSAATLQINSSSATMSTGGIMTLSVVVNSEGIAINNAEAKIIFPADLLEVVSISKGGSVFSLWVEEPAYSNITGIVSFNGGIPAPGFNGSSGTALSIVVKAKKAGVANVILSEAAVRANDGLGTDVLGSKRDRTITIANKEVPAATPAPTPTPPAATPAVTGLQITSPSHPSQEGWYAESDSLFRWKIPAGADAIQTGIDNDTLGSPRVTYRPGISEKSVENLEDGIWYFKARAQNDGVWGPVSTYIARVDTTIPVNKGVAFAYDDDAKMLSIEADIIDETSGLNYYEIYINDALIKKVPAAEFVDGTYDLPYAVPGENVVYVRAFDRAGNSIESTTETFETTAAVLAPTVPDERLLISIGTFAIPALYVFGVLLAGLTVLILGAFRLGRHYNKIRSKSRVRASLAKGDHSKILLSLKKRLEKHLDILQRIRQSRILSKEEKEIKEALEGDLDEIDRALEGHKAE